MAVQSHFPVLPWPIQRLDIFTLGQDSLMEQVHEVIIMKQFVGGRQWVLSVICGGVYVCVANPFVENLAASPPRSQPRFLVTAVYAPRTIEFPEMTSSSMQRIPPCPIEGPLLSDIRGIAPRIFVHILSVEQQPLRFPQDRTASNKLKHASGREARYAGQTTERTW